MIIYFVLMGRYFLKKWAELLYSFLSFNKLNKTGDQIQCLCLKSKEWNYRGEGNEYLALSLPESKQILRIKKYAYSNGYLDTLLEWFNKNNQWHLQSEAKLLEKLNLDYYKVMTVLIGECYVKPAIEVCFIQSEVDKINKKIEELRPESRKKKFVGNVCGSLLADYAYLPAEWECNEMTSPVFALEIKPKHGWIPMPERKYPICTFCHNQFIKLDMAEAKTFSKYCPMDLFSGDTKRIKLAVVNLLKTPQNNFKIFKNGCLVYGDDISKDCEEDVLREWLSDSQDETPESVIDVFSDLTTNALLANLSTDEYQCDKPEHNCSIDTNFQIKDAKDIRHCNFTKTALPQGCVLEKILKLQELDQWGAEMVLQALEVYSDVVEEEKYEHVKKVMNQMMNCQVYKNCPHCLFDINSSEKTLKCADVKNMLYRYLMSAVAKDCSLMLTFQKMENEGNHNVPQNNVFLAKNNIKYAFNVAVFDLYPKSATSIYKHVKKRKQFETIYNSICDKAK